MPALAAARRAHSEPIPPGIDDPRRMYLLGDFAIRYGYQQFRTDITLATVVLLLVVVQLLQWAGDRWARRLATS